MNPAEIPILHVDMDAFYASVEVRDNPSLAGLPVCVGGPASGRGVVSAASYEARRFGIHSAMPTAVARRACPDMILLPPDFEKYTRVSAQVMDVFRSYTPLVEPLSLDEAFLDTTGCERLFGDSIEIGRAIKRDILRETGLVASVGVACSKFLAKLASELDKPDGFRVIRPDEIREVLDPLPISHLFGIGERTAKRFEALGIETISDLASMPRDKVVADFGASGAWVHDLAHGLDPRRVAPHRREKSHGMERTFAEDIADRDELRAFLLQFCEEVAFGLRDRGLRGRTITLKARSPDFKTVTRTRTLDYPTGIGARIYSVARELLEQVPPGPLRLVGVSVSNLEDVRAPLQRGLFGAGGDPGRTRSDWLATREKLERITPSLDKLRRRFGRGTVQPARLLGRAVKRAEPAPRMDPDPKP
ncbi:MAG: DNA polymerase IV [Planctomycetota bacterium]|nr:DNA polymerase IV [Planctomycetota bacterium]MDP6764131.1 DNA polymerase IV [Planctomycetota bacterium]MDP6989580.1 DNA polymerase IV [Planctomycetota bacterium]